MNVRAFVSLAAAVFVLAVGVRSHAQKAANGSKDTASTMSGVFTNAQAARGEETYMTICVGCHPAGTYATDAFVATWSNRMVADLFTLIKETMPKVDPGTLSDREIAQVIAYILKSNRVPAGRTELSSDVETLRTIRLQFPSK